VLSFLPFFRSLVQHHRLCSRRGAACQSLPAPLQTCFSKDSFPSRTENLFFFLPFLSPSPIPSFLFDAGFFLPRAPLLYVWLSLCSSLYLKTINFFAIAYGTHGVDHENFFSFLYSFWLPAFLFWRSPVLQSARYRCLDSRSTAAII